MRRRSSRRGAPLALTVITLGGCASILDVDGTWQVGDGGGPSVTVGAGAGVTGGSACDQTSPECQLGECVALEDNSGHALFTLRMAQLTLTHPPALTLGIVSTIVEGSVLMTFDPCRLTGPGTFSWLLRFDVAFGEITTGGALPVIDPRDGYSFLEGTVGGVPVAPVVASVAHDDATGSFTSTAGVDLNIPIFLDAEATSAIVLPLRQLRFDGTLSADHNCIGSYNAAGLSPGNNCVADGVNRTFINGALVDAHIPLEAADAIVIDSIGQSLCVLLSGDAATFGDGGKPVNRCKRDPSTDDIVLQGDWCAATDTPSSASCADAVKFSGAFAASSVKRVFE